MYLQDVAAFTGIPQGRPIPISADNTGCIVWSKELGNFSNRKHIDLSTWIVHDATKDGLIVLHQVPSAENKADAMTKVLPTVAECIRQFQAISTYLKDRHFTNL